MFFKNIDILILIRPSSDAVDGLDKQVKDLRDEIESLKQAHKNQIDELNEKLKNQENEFEKEKAR